MRTTTSLTAWRSRESGSLSPLNTGDTREGMSSACVHVHMKHQDVTGHCTAKAFSILRTPAASTQLVFSRRCTCRT